MGMLFLLAACNTPPDESADPLPHDTPDGETGETGDTDSPAHEWPDSLDVTVEVRLDGEPVQGAIVTQGGNPTRWESDAEGMAQIVLDGTIYGAKAVAASVPQARILGVEFYDPPTEPVRIELISYDASGNPEYTFADPGSPARRGTTGQCAHCHVTINEDWYGSAHRQSASNPAVQDMYAGTASALDEAACETAGGNWWEGTRGFQCYLGNGTLPHLNDCGGDASCDDVATEFGGCADCHAPGIDGAAGGRDLLEVAGHAYESGVHCDVCHRVSEVDLEAAPGVAGRLVMVRPTETSRRTTWEHLLFGPYPDVPNPFMGSVYRPLFREAEICGACHELEQDTTASERWPDGRLPVHSTYGEWTEHYVSSKPCQTCHMPEDELAGNGADLGNYFDVTPGIGPGWYREAGEVRRHNWLGPRTPGSLIEEAIELETEQSDSSVTATVRNVGAGHAVPTGEPLRSLLLVVQATCESTPIYATSGPVVPDFGGYYAKKSAGEDWSNWPEAETGQVIRVIRFTGEYWDYAGYGRFGDGSLGAEERGMPVEEAVGATRVVSVDSGVVTLDGELPDGDLAYLGDDVRAWAGAAGFGFAKVLTAADGRRMVPHFEAVDVASDNRLLPQYTWTGTHGFTDCDAPASTTSVIHRAYPLSLALERGWDVGDTIFVAR